MSRLLIIDAHCRTSPWDVGVYEKPSPASPGPERRCVCLLLKTYHLLRTIYYVKLVCASGKVQKCPNA